MILALSVTAALRRHAAFVIAVVVKGETVLDTILVLAAQHCVMNVLMRRAIPRVMGANWMPNVK
jgi:hypothetical protein